MELLKGKDPSNKVKEDCKAKCIEFQKEYGRKPTLAVVLIGHDGASETYVASKRKACDEVGIKHLDILREDDISREELLEIVDNLNNDSGVDGVLVQLPLPSHINEKEIIEKISPDKDVDGFTPENVGKMLLGHDGLISCTPLGIMYLMEYYGVETEGRNVCILGRSNIVGKPVAALLLRKGKDAVVTVCHSKTINFRQHLKDADIIILAMGNPLFLKSDMVKDGAVIIDVGTTRVEDKTAKRGWRLKGDADRDDFNDRNVRISPVPGGVGPMTVAMLMHNTVEAAFALKKGNK